jgi:heme-degrading monooxygenase HmoA
MSGHYLAVWEFQVRSAALGEFELIYGASGSWAGLFRKSSEYLGTELVRDPDHPGRYLTIDRWTSREAFLRFKQEHATEYAALDETCDRLTTAEKFVGSFESLTPGTSAPSLLP